VSTVIDMKTTSSDASFGVVIDETER